MRDPDAAAHGLGKLFKYAGEDNVLWGTDSIWYGSPQDQIQAFRTFQIADALADKHGYPRTHAGAAREGLRPQCAARLQGARRRVEAASAARSRRRATARNTASGRIRRFVTYGPKTRREFLTLKAWSGGR